MAEFVLSQRPACKAECNSLMISAGCFHGDRFNFTRFGVKRISLCAMHGRGLRFVLQAALTIVTMFVATSWQDGDQPRKPMCEPRLVADIAHRVGSEHSVMTLVGRGSPVSEAHRLVAKTTWQHRRSKSRQNLIQQKILFPKLVQASAEDVSVSENFFALAGPGTQGPYKASCKTSVNVASVAAAFVDIFIDVPVLKVQKWARPLCQVSWRVDLLLSAEMCSMLKCGQN